MSAPARTSAGGRLERARALRFEFDGRSYQGCAGDTLASALLANGVHLVGRSFKYHRPRGVMAAGPEDPNALVTVRRDAGRYTPNLNAAQVELYDGLVAESQNRWPSLEFDVGRINDKFSRFLPAGFYYKTFMWPRRAWHGLYEPRIRAAAGLGRAPPQADPDHYAQRHAHCDVLVVGAGPAGLAAALAAARGGADVLLCDEQAELGGSLLAPGDAIDGVDGADWLRATLAQLAALPNARMLARTTAFAYLPHNLVALVERVTDHLADPPAAAPRERLWQVRAAEVVLATGAIERPLVFPGNDLPGIMLADAARIYLKRYGVLAGSRVAVVTAHDAAYRAAVELHAAGAQVVALADLRRAADGALPEAARRAGLPIRTGATALRTRGNTRVAAIELGTVQADGKVVADGRWTECDAVLMCGGFTPTVHLFSQSRGQLAWDAQAQVFVPAAAAQNCRSVGACAGPAGAPDLYATGWLGELPHPESPTRGKAFVDWQNDVTAADLGLAIREGFRSIEHIKRYTTTGMATDQGKTSNLNALAIAAQRLQRDIPAVGHTTFRMPYLPVSFGSLAGAARGELFNPVRRTPMHAWATGHGAVFEPVGLWQRARYFPRGSEDLHAAVARECMAVRRSVGMFDASTLGKIEVVGPDAAEFLERLYVNSWKNLKSGRSRYGILLRDDGFVFDDGVVARLAADRFHVTTTTGGAPRVLALMEDYLQTEWPELKVWLTSTTEQWAVIALQGPRARELLQPLVSGIDLSPSALPHMAVAHGQVCGVPAMVFRVSFTGELGFEVNVPADHGLALWRELWAAGRAFDIVPYGTEAMHVLRAEKGYIIVGQDTDGTVTVEDAGLGWAVGKGKPDFVGRASMRKAALQSPDRKQLVGLRTVDPAVVLEEGSQIAARRGLRAPMPLIGHVTSSYHSAVLGHSIALALVSGGRTRLGQEVYVPTPTGEHAATICNPVFYDPKGTRLDG